MTDFPFSELVLILYTISLSILLVFSSHGFIMLFYQHKHRNKIQQTLENVDTSKIVTIQLPLYNELYVVERLIDSVCKLDYPKENLEIQVLDDSTDETIELVAGIVQRKKDEGFLISHIRRTDRTGFKAGALKNGLAEAKGEFIAIFDADFLPPADFLKKTLPHFYSSKIGMVQTRWGHINEKQSLLTRVQAFALDGHFAIEQKVRNDAGFFINFNGTGGVWKKECIVDAGNWANDTLTEDLDLSYRAQLRGWQFVYLKDVTTPAELPEEMSALKSQQFRWTKGAIETAKKLLPTIWKSNLSLRLKLQSTFHLTNNFVFPFVLVVALLNLPLLFIKHAGNFDAYFRYSSLFIVAFFSTFFLYTSAQKNIYQDWKKRILIFPVFLSGTMGFALNNSKAVMEGVFNKKSEFVRTPKFASNSTISVVNKYVAGSKISALLFVEIIFAFYSFVGVITSIYFMELAALPFNLMFFFGFFSVAVLSLKQVMLKNK